MIFCDVSPKRILSGRLGNNLFKIATSISISNDKADSLYVWG